MSAYPPPAAPALPFPACDLRRHAPRSPRAKLGGLFFLARTIDKVRASLQDTLGDYRVTPGLSGTLFDCLGISVEQFTLAVHAARNDEEVVDWLLARTDPTRYDEINHRLETRAVADRAQFEAAAASYPVLRTSSDVRNWFEILELDDRCCFAAPAVLAGS